MSAPSTLTARKAVTIIPRNVSFERQRNQERWWHNGDPVATAFYNALSLSFPQGEAYFVQSVRHYLQELSEPLLSQASAFAQQEAHHSREHMAFNRLVEEAGSAWPGVAGRVAGTQYLTPLE